MKQNLTISERFSIMELLPKEGNFATISLIRKLREKLSLTEEEIKQHNITTTDSIIRWSNNTEKEKEFSVFEEETIEQQLIQLNKYNKMEDKHFSLYNKFVLKGIIDNSDS